MEKFFWKSMYFVILYGAAALCFYIAYTNFFNGGEELEFFATFLIALPCFVLGCIISFWTTIKLIVDIGEFLQAKKEREANIKRGKKFLEELRKAPYNNDKVGQSFIKKTSSKPKTVKDTSNLKPGGKFYELFKDVEFNNALAGKSFIRKVSKKK